MATIRELIQIHGLPIRVYSSLWKGNFQDLDYFILSKVSQYNGHKYAWGTSSLGMVRDYSEGPESMVVWHEDEVKLPLDSTDEWELVAQ